MPGLERAHCPAGHPVIAEAGFYLETLAPAMPLMYLESMVDGAMKGVGEQKAAFRYSVRFCGGVRFSLPSLIWMPMPLSSIMWISGR